MNWRRMLVTAAVLFGGCESPGTTASRDPAATSCPLGSFSQVDLVSDQPVAAILDPTLTDPWGLATSGVSPFWVASRGSRVIDLYTDGASGIAKNPLTVTSANNPPTGVVFNPGHNFKITSGGSPLA